MGPKEKAYDERISPCMVEIIRECKAAGINAFMTFCLDDDPDEGQMKCTTALPVDDTDSEGVELVDRLRSIARPSAPAFVAMTITSRDARTRAKRDG